MRALQRLLATGVLAVASTCVGANPMSLDGPSNDSGIRGAPHLSVDGVAATDSDIVNLSLTAFTVGGDSFSVLGTDTTGTDDADVLPVVVNDAIANAPTSIESIALFPNGAARSLIDEDDLLDVGSEWTDTIALRTVSREIAIETVPAPLLLALLGIGLALLGLFGRRR